MRKLWPFLGIAVAVAVGVALSRHIWRLLGIVVVAAVVCLALGLLWIVWQWVKRIAAWCWAWFMAQGVESPPR